MMSAMFSVEYEPEVNIKLRIKTASQSDADPNVVTSCKA